MEVKTIKDALSVLRENILSDLPFFCAGFSCVSKDAEGINIPHQGGAIVFPADHLGSYFYFRSDGASTFDVDGRQKFPVTLVVYLENMDAAKVASKLVLSLRKCGDAMIKLGSIVSDNSYIIRREVSRERFDDAIRSLRDDISLLMLNFTVTMPLVFNSWNAEGCVDDFTNCCQ